VNVLVTRGLVKRYGDRVALDGLDIEIPKGSICAVIGPNGAGKTTAFSLIAGILMPNAGSIELFGEGPFDAKRHSGRLSLMPQDALPSAHATLTQSLRHYARLQGMSAGDAAREAQHWLGRLRLEDRAHARQHQLSHGMRRRFSIAQAFLGNPELVLLDEPTAGLDPELVAEMRTLFSERRGERTLLISSHVLSELEGLCDHAVFIDAGRTVRQGSMSALRHADSRVRVTLSRAPDLPALERELGAVRLDWRQPELSVQFSGTEPIDEQNAKLLRALLDQGAGILALEAGQSLEKSYLETRQAGAGRVGGGG
jgi:ABC-2 type transport system ATP-binding protein